jgi:hypothetical protein
MGKGGKMKIVIASTLSYIFNKLYLKIDEYIKKDIKKHLSWYFKHCKLLEILRDIFSVLSEILFYIAFILIIIWIIKGELI